MLLLLPHFAQGLRDEIPEKLGTHDVQDVSELFSLADKCARAIEERAWHSQPAPEAGKASNHDADGAAQSSGKNKKKKMDGSNNKPLAGAPTTVLLLQWLVVGVVVHMATNGRGIPSVVTRAICGAQYTTTGATARSARNLRSM
jgi:hypothetical protein